MSISVSRFVTVVWNDLFVTVVWNGALPCWACPLCRTYATSMERGKSDIPYHTNRFYTVDCLILFQYWKPLYIAMYRTKFDIRENIMVWYIVYNDITLAKKYFIDRVKRSEMKTEFKHLKCIKFLSFCVQNAKTLIENTKKRRRKNLGEDTTQKKNDRFFDMA